MIVRQSCKLLLNLGNYSNITLESEVCLDSESADDRNIVQGYTTDEVTSASWTTFDEVCRNLLLESIQEQKKAIEELNDEFFKKG